MGIGCGIAAFFVARNAVKIAHDPPKPVYSMDEAYGWVEERLPDEVAATLTPDDVRQILAWQVEYMTQAGVVGPAQKSTNLISDAEIAGYIQTKSATNGEELITEQIYPVVDIQLDYMRAIGAISTSPST